FSGDHPMLEQAYHPMVIRFYILQTHYRSTLDFSNEALQASERALKRLWEAYGLLQALQIPEGTETEADHALVENIQQHCRQSESDLKDDFNTAKVLAHLFELVPTINSLGVQIPFSKI